MSVITRKTTAAEIIAEMLGCDISDVREMAYQPTRHKSPSIYSWNDEPWSFFCCPTKVQKLPNLVAREKTKWEIAGYSWRETNKDRPVYGVRWTKD
jgi:hypothetical protein